MRRGVVTGGRVTGRLQREIALRLGAIGQDYSAVWAGREARTSTGSAKIVA